MVVFGGLWRRTELHRLLKVPLSERSQEEASSDGTQRLGRPYFTPPPPPPASYQKQQLGYKCLSRGCIKQRASDAQPEIRTVQHLVSLKTKLSM